MSARRVANTPEDQALKAQTGKLIRAAGGVDAAAEIARPDMRRFSEYQRPDTDCFIPADAIRDLERITHGSVGHPLVTRWLAQTAGYALVRLPEAGATAGDLCAALSETIAGGGAVATGVIEALRDGECDARERADLAPKCIEAAEAFIRLHALLAAGR